MSDADGCYLYCAGCSRDSEKTGKLTHEKWCDQDYRQIAQLGIRKNGAEVKKK